MKINKNSIKILSLVVLLGICESLWSQTDTSKLTINQQAPPIKVEKWLKGHPITSFEKGQVYIIELGFISCAPCRVAIPHLTELAKKYKGKANVISIFVYENNKDVPGKLYINKVEKFINSYGDKIGYTVAVDDERQTIARAWYEPASRVKDLGFPAMFIIDQDRKIVWIGNASEPLDEIVQKVIDRKFDAAVGENVQNEDFEFSKKIGSLIKSKDFNTAISIYDSLIKSTPGNTLLHLAKFKILLEADMGKALTYGRELLLNQCKDVEPVLNYMAQDIMGMRYIEKNRNYQDLIDLAINLTDRAISLSKSEQIFSTLFQTQAMAYCYKGDYKKAVNKQELAIKWFEKGISIDPYQEQKSKKIMMNTLDKYRNALKSGVMKW